MRNLIFALAFLSPLLLAGCEEKQQSAPPAPFTLTTDAIGRYCGMNVLEHDAV